jgi:hypothetical protein
VGPTISPFSRQESSHKHSFDQRCFPVRGLHRRVRSFHFLFFFPNRLVRMYTRSPLFLLLASFFLLFEFVSAQDYLKILQPKEKRYLKPGATYQILWTANQTTQWGDELLVVSIELLSDQAISTIFPGNPCESPQSQTTCIEIASNISNIGNWTWSIPANAPQSPNYYLDIYVPNPPEGGPYYWMTGNFSINATTPSNSLLTVPTYSPESASVNDTATGSSNSSSSAVSNGIPLRNSVDMQIQVEECQQQLSVELLGPP